MFDEIDKEKEKNAKSRRRCRQTGCWDTCLASFARSQEASDSIININLRITINHENGGGRGEKKRKKEAI